MALSSNTVVDKIEMVGDFKIIQVRSLTIVNDGDTEISRSFSRHTVCPDASDAEISAQTSDVKKMITEFHTDEVKTAYSTHLESLVTHASNLTEATLDE